MASNDWKKMTIYDAGGMNRHNGKYERENGNHSNRHIDKSKSHLNLYIGCDDYSEACHNMKARVQEVDKLYPPKRKNKSDTRIICTMIVVPCPQEICERGYDATKQFFYDMISFTKIFSVLIMFMVVWFTLMKYMSTLTKTERKKCLSLICTH